MTVPVFFDLVGFLTATTGTGTMTVGSALPGHRTPAGASIANSTKVRYSIRDGSNYETGLGTYTSSGTTLSRDTIVASSNSGSAITLSGTAEVVLTILATDLPGSLPFGPFTSLASAATCDLSSVATVGVNITGTTAITSFGSAALNLFRILKFAGALTLTYNATSLIIPGAANITTAAGDTAIVLSDGSGNWTVVDYIRASGVREKLAAGRTYYVGFNLPTPTISIASPAVVSSTAHGRSANDPVVFFVPLNTKAATISAANPAVVTMANSFAAGQPVKFSSSGSLPYGIVPGTTYYVIAAGLSGSQFEFSATVGGSAISTAAPTAGFTNGSANITISAANTYYSVGQRIRFATTGGLPTNFAAATDYFIVSASSTLITVSATNGGSAIVAGSAGSGTQTAVQSGSHFCETTGALPTGITEGTIYYIISAGLTANAFQVSATQGGSAINTSGSVTGSPIYGAYTGNDSNTGLAQTAAAAFLTLQKGWNTLVGNIDLGGQDTSIQMCDGPFAGFSTSGPWTGGGTITVQGTNTSNSVITSNVDLSGNIPSTLYFDKVKFTGSSNRNINHTGSGIVRLLGGVEFGANPSGYHLNIEGVGAKVYAQDNYKISGGCGLHARVYSQSNFTIEGGTITIAGNPALGTFLDAELGSTGRLTPTYVGGCTGTKYFVGTNAAVDANGSPTSIPGNVAGSTSSGGQIN